MMLRPTCRALLYVWTVEQVSIVRVHTPRTLGGMLFAVQVKTEKTAKKEDASGKRSARLDVRLLIVYSFSYWIALN